MNIEKMALPSWSIAVQIYCDVLENPKASFLAKKNARDDLLRLATIVDKKKDKA